MAITEIKHEWSQPEPGEPSVLHVRFDRELTEREANEVAQAVVGVHNRHEVARDFAANDPHHVRHLTKKDRDALTTETPDFEEGEGTVDETGEEVFVRAPVIHPESGEQTITRTFSGTCGDCGRGLVAGADPNLPYHFVCPSLPSETDPFIRFREKPAAEGDHIYCGRPPA
jgi:hypothetical protein